MSTTDALSDHGDVDCGRVESCVADPLARTLFLRTDTHGMTLEWPGGHSEDDVPLVGSKVTLHWGDEVSVSTERGLQFLRVRQETPVMETEWDRIRAAAAVGIGATLWMATVLALMRVLGRAFGFAGDSFDTTSSLIDLTVLMFSSASLLLFRRMVPNKLQKKSLGVLARRDRS